MGLIGTTPVEDVQIPIEDEELYEDRFKHNEGRKFVHIVIFQAYDASMYDLTACGLFGRFTRKGGKNDRKCPDCELWEMTHYNGIN